MTSPETDRTVLSVMPRDLPEAWHGAATWTEVPGGQQPWRVRPAQLERILSPRMVELARIPNGVRLAVRTDARSLEVELSTEEADADPVRRLDVLVDGERVASPRMPGRSRAVIPLPGRSAEVELWLSHSAPTLLHEVALHGAGRCAALPPRGPRWTVYGSSITQGNHAASPTGTWPALAAAQNSYELTALGMSGQCHLDPPLASTILESAPDLITLCLGANIYGGATFTERSLPPAVIGFVDRLRAGTAVPILVLSTITSGVHREEQANAAGLDQRDVRELVRRSIEVVQQQDPRVRFVDGTEILRAEELHLAEDLLHPGPEGLALMAGRIAPHLAAALAGAGSPQG